MPTSQAHRELAARQRDMSTTPYDELDRGTGTGEFRRVDRPSIPAQTISQASGGADNVPQAHRPSTAITRSGSLVTPGMLQEHWATLLSGSVTNVQEVADPFERTVVHPSAIADRAARSRRAAIARPRQSLTDNGGLPPGTRLREVTKWEGRVTSVEPEAGVFVVDLQPLANTHTAMEAEFALDSMGESDAARVRPGSLVYVTVRTTRDRNRQPRRETTIRPQRLGRWTEYEVERFLSESRQRHAADADLFS